MVQRTCVMVLTLFLLAMAPLSGTSTDADQSLTNSLSTENTRIEISPDSNSIQSLGESIVIEGFERNRENIAESSIGLYTENGLIPSVSIPDSLALVRSDLAMVIVGGGVGIWDARIAVEESGNLEIRTTVPPSGFLVQGDEKQLSELADVSVVEAVHSVPAGILVHPVLRVVDEGPIMVEILGWKDDELQRHSEPGLDIDDSLSNVAQMWMTDSWSPEEGRVWGEINLRDIGVIAQHPSVAWISPLPVLELLNDNARNWMGIDTVESYFITDLDGDGQTIAVGDSGIDHDHGDFNGRIVGRTSVTPGDSSTADTSDGHGTHVACTVLGSGMRSSGTYAGVAPEASLYFQAMEDDDTGSLYSYGINSMLNSAYNSGARLHTNSWGAGSGSGSYSTQSEDADDRTSTWDQYWSYEGMTVLFAAGNERNDGVSPPGTAKNVITIGGHKNRYSGSPDEMYYWSSRGPTDDGRIKPDVVGPGDGVRSCLSQEAENADSGWSNNWYIEYSGTSMATPAAAGAATLVRQYLMDVANRPAPQGALVKALLILGAKDMGARNIPNDDEGWGRVSLINSLIPDSDEGIFVDDRNRVKSGQTREYTYDITRANEPLKIVLAWSDYPGSSTSSSQLRNDLNLEVVNPNGNIYKGNVFNSGRSITGGSWDDTNNVEVVLIDSASVGTWTVKVKDDYHGGSRTWQPYAIAVRGVNVNDLSPDPAFSPDVLVEPIIPQLGEEVDITVTVNNLGAGSISDLEVMARANGSLISTQVISLSPGESTDISWSWTATQQGEIPLSFHIDPNDLVDEASESNNLLTHMIQVSAPGVRVSSSEALITLGDATDSSTSWNIVLSNTALFETNATIESSPPRRMSDGLEFDWFYSFTSTNFNLAAAESVDIGFTLIHPAPPQPGTYEIIVTGTDVENSVESMLSLYFEVPILAEAEVDIHAEQIHVSPLTKTSAQFHVTNLGNGPQTYDVELVSPSGWHLGLDVLGTFEGSSHGSTGTLAVGEQRAIDLTINPPGAMIPAGSVFDAAINVRSRVSNDVWSIDIPLLVIPIDQLSTTPISDGVEHQISPDATLELKVDFLNTGNRDLELTPHQVAIPGGWNVVGALQSLTAPAGSTTQWTVVLQGNGLAVSGDFKLRFITDDGFSIDWNRTLDVLSAALPTIQFHQIAFADGSSSESPLGLGAHPVGEAFDLAWKVENEGTSTWRPETTIILPSTDWIGNCPSSPSSLSPGSSTIIWCTITIPLSAESGTEPSVTLSMTGEGLTAEHSVSLQVASVQSIVWELQTDPVAHEGYPILIKVRVENIGNSPINHRLDVSESSWDITILSEVLIMLQPGESTIINIQFEPDSGSDGSIQLSLLNGESISNSVFVIDIDVMPGKGDESALSSSLVLIIFVLVVGIIAGTGLFVYKKKGGNFDQIFANEAISKISESLNKYESESGSGIECWVCSRDIFVGEAWACGQCGARYHKAQQVRGCDIVSLGRCLHCNAESDELVEA